MNREERIKLINKLENHFDGPLVVYVTGDRPNLATKIAPDTFPIFHKHLREIGKQKCINLFLYSAGGVTTTGFAIVNLFKEFCDELNIIVPFKAFSTATIMCLGADKIIMTPIGQLGPIEPSVEHVLGPRLMAPIPGQNIPPQALIPVNVEEVTGFMKMAEKKLGLKKEESKLKIFELLTSQIHPLTLGHVQRSLEQIKFLATTLMEDRYEQDKIDNVVKILTQERYSHDYIISRKEAEEVLKLNIIEPNKEQENDIMKLFNAYNDILELTKPYNDETELGNQPSKIVPLNRIIIESENLTYVYKTTKEIRAVNQAISQMQQPVQPQMQNIQQTMHPGVIQAKVLSEEWVEDNKL